MVEPTSEELMGFAMSQGAQNHHRQYMWRDSRLTHVSSQEKSLRRIGRLICLRY